MSESTRLHLVMQRPQAAGALDQCLAHSSAGDRILLLEDAVYALFGGHWQRSRLIGADTGIYLLLPDFLARGGKVADLPDSVTPVDHGGFVELVEGTRLIQSWD